jgi:hypothetical protein
MQLHNNVNKRLGKPVFDIDYDSKFDTSGGTDKDIKEYSLPYFVITFTIMMLLPTNNNDECEFLIKAMPYCIPHVVSSDKMYSIVNRLKDFGFEEKYFANTLYTINRVVRSELNMEHISIEQWKRGVADIFKIKS